MMKIALGAAIAALATTGVIAQDPAQGWMGYAVGSNNGKRIDYIEAKWKVGAAPRASSAFFSPWFGIESSDNLNLIQPVNPWEGSSWSIYNEYFQWSPENNKNSASHTVKPGQVLLGSVTYNNITHAYDMLHTSDDGWSVKTSIPIQKKDGEYKTYSILYFVYEKVVSCGMYPPDGSVTFYDIVIRWEDGSDNNSTNWKTAYVDDNCNNRAHIIDPATIQITWDVNGVSSPKALANDKAKVTGLHSHPRHASTIVETDADADVNTTCAAGRTPCEYLPGQIQCCTAGEMCIKNVGCRC